MAMTPHFKLLVSDLDGTLLPAEGGISARVKTAVQRARECGIRFTLASGRTYAATLAFAEELGTDAPLICYQGALVKDPRSGEVLHAERIQPEVMRDVVLFCRENDIHLNVYIDDLTYMERSGIAAELYHALARFLELHLVPDLLEVLDRPPFKCIFVSETAEKTEALLPRLEGAFGARLRIVRSHPLLIEGAPLTTSKGRALQLLAARLGIKQCETVAIGDNDNDIEMLTWAGLGLAMANSSPEVLAVTPYVLPPVWADGAAYGIEQYVLREECLSRTNSQRQKRFGSAHF